MTDSMERVKSRVGYRLMGRVTWSVSSRAGYRVWERVHTWVRLRVRDHVAESLDA